MGPAEFCRPLHNCFPDILTSSQYIGSAQEKWKTVMNSSGTHATDSIYTQKACGVMEQM